MGDRGKYIVIEGHDGVGKSTQVERLAARLATAGIESFVAHEPAGTPTADAIREVIKNGTLERDPLTNVLLFTASRREIWLEARKKLARGAWVLSARNYLSTEAYQGHGEGVSLTTIRELTRSYVGEDYFTPDHTFILTMNDADSRARRITQRGNLSTPDTFEMRDESYQETVHGAYLQIARDHNITPIDATQSIDTIQDYIQAAIGTLLPDTTK